LPINQDQSIFLIPICFLQTDERKETDSILSQKPWNNKKEPFWTQLHGPCLPNQTILEYKIKTTNRKQEKNWHNIDQLPDLSTNTTSHISVTENLIKATTPPKQRTSSLYNHGWR
jgi:hypothetical protein